MFITIIFSLEAKMDSMSLDIKRWIGLRLREFLKIIETPPPRAFLWFVSVIVADVKVVGFACCAARVGMAACMALDKGHHPTHACRQ